MTDFIVGDDVQRQRVAASGTKPLNSSADDIQVNGAVVRKFAQRHENAGSIVLFEIVRGNCALDQVVVDKDGI